MRKQGGHTVVGAYELAGLGRHGGELSLALGHIHVDGAELAEEGPDLPHEVGADATESIADLLQLRPERGGRQLQDKKHAWSA